MRNQWKPQDKLRHGKHKKQGDVSPEERTMQMKIAQEDLELLQKQFAKQAKRLEKKKMKRAK